MGNTHTEPDPLRPSKASMSNILLLTSVKVQCLASCAFSLLVKQPEVLREPSPSIEWSRKKIAGIKLVTPRNKSITKHGRICFPILFWSHLAPITTISPSLTALLLHRKIHPPWNPIILCNSWVTADNSVTPQLTKMTFSIQEAQSLFFPLFYSWFSLLFLILSKSPNLWPSSSITEQGEHIVVQSVFIWGQQGAKENFRDTPGSKAMTPDPTASSSRHQIKRHST